MNKSISLESEPEPPSIYLASIFLFFGLSLSAGLGFAVFALLLLIISSALVSGSEVAFFSITVTQKAELELQDDKSSHRVLRLISKPARLLGTILISNNFINIAIILLSDYILREMFGLSFYIFIADWVLELMPFLGSNSEVFAERLQVFTTVGLVTFFLVLFGEIAPKLYSAKNNIKMSLLMSFPLMVLGKLFAPFTKRMEKWGWFLKQQLVQNANTPIAQTKQELDKAIELTTNKDDDHSIRQQDILKGLLVFNEVIIKQIMRSRVDMIGEDISSPYSVLMALIKKEGFSRIPIYEDDLDQIKGLLYVKDLLPHLDKDDSFDWRKLLRTEVMYVPESKKISALLSEFQENRMHLAIVVDEYGGTSGLVTLEDVLEEVIGEIKDEFDDEIEADFSLIGKDTYSFEGKILLNDVCKIIKEDTKHFDAYRGDADSIAGLFLEVTGRLPVKMQEIKVGRYNIIVTEVSKRRIERVTLKKLPEANISFRNRDKISQ